MFDLSLVGLSIPDMLYEVLQDGASSGGSFTWLRLLRLLKMMKMLRVVRVMRFFRVLRMMLESITDGLTTLFWSILLLALVMYIFGLCFLQALSGYLLETPSDQVRSQVVDDIDTYWGGVATSTTTLYLAITGGADWEVLAGPVKETGNIYYLLFLFYIAFTSFAVLNVLTGMFVETANAVAQEDEEQVSTELLERPETQACVAMFKKEADTVDPSHTHECETMVTAEVLEDIMMRSEFAEFMDMIEVAKTDIRKIFLARQQDGQCELHSFIKGCLNSKSSSSQRDLAVLSSETKKTHKVSSLHHAVHPRTI